MPLVKFLMEFMCLEKFDDNKFKNVKWVFNISSILFKSTTYTFKKRKYVPYRGLP
jgi:hypothetical protein